MKRALVALLLLVAAVLLLGTSLLGELLGNLPDEMTPPAGCIEDCSTPAVASTCDGTFHMLAELVTRERCQAWRPVAAWLLWGALGLVTVLAFTSGPGQRALSNAAYSVAALAGAVAAAQSLAELGDIFETGGEAWYAAWDEWHTLTHWGLKLAAAAILMLFAAWGGAGAKRYPKKKPAPQGEDLHEKQVAE